MAKNKEPKEPLFTYEECAGIQASSSASAEPPAPVYVENEHSVEKTRIRWAAFENVVKSILFTTAFIYLLHVLNAHTGAW